MVTISEVFNLQLKEEPSNPYFFEVYQGDKYIGYIVQLLGTWRAGNNITYNRGYEDKGAAAIEEYLAYKGEGELVSNNSQMETITNISQVRLQLKGVKAMLDKIIILERGKLPTNRAEYDNLIQAFDAISKAIYKLS